MRLSVSIKFFEFLVLELKPVMISKGAGKKKQYEKLPYWPRTQNWLEGEKQK